MDANTARKMSERNSCMNGNNAFYNTCQKDIANAIKYGRQEAVLVAYSYYGTDAVKVALETLTSQGYSWTYINAMAIKITW